MNGTWLLTRILDGIGPGAVGQTGTSSGALEPSITGPTDRLARKGNGIGGILEIADWARGH